MKNNIKAISIIVTLLVIAILGFISITFLKKYGWLIFFFIPSLIGFLPAFISSTQKEITKKEAFNLGFSTLGCAFLGLIIFALEGFICILMAAPLAALLTWLGSYIAFAIQKNRTVNPTNTAVLLLLASIGLMSFDLINEPKGLIAVKTTIVVHSTIDEVWQNVVTFDKIEEPTDWIFKTGIAYPTDATIQGVGVGAVRYCNFTTGSFVEPITTWNEPNLLQFDVKEQPIPMNEFNPFWEVHPPHLDGYFKSYKGQFKLTKLGENSTELEGTTWYQVDIHPEIYWKTWSNFIVHKIHLRVLNHIKKEAEKE